MPTQEMRLPLSGDVSQTIIPWTWFFKSTGSQFGLFNINVGTSSDPQLERTILDDVGSYGRQLGQIGDALRVLLNYVNPQGLPPEQQRMLTALNYQLDQIDRLKSARRASTTGE